MSIDERNATIIHLREQGQTLESIGARYGLTRERVRQIVAKNGGPDRRVLRERRARSTAFAAQRVADQVRRFLLEHPGVSLEEAFEALGITDVRERRWATTVENKRLSGVSVSNRWRGGAKQAYSPEDCLRALRQAYEIVAAEGQDLTYQAYKRLHDEGRVTGPGYVRLTQRYRTWLKALEAAGVPVSDRQRVIHTRRSYARRWTNEQMLAYVVEYLSTDGYTGSFDGYDAWRVATGSDAPSGQTVRNVLGTWAQIKASALAVVAARGA